MNLKHEYGQYFTEEKLSDFVVKKTLPHTNNPKRILEPSFGDGQFVRSLLKEVQNAEIDAYEIDSEVYVDVEGANCYLTDFLFSENNKKYHLIIGNPPYIELPYSFYKGDDLLKFKNNFERIGRGRVNLVHAFFDKSFQLLENGGILSFLLPTTVLTSPWYNDIRRTIYEKYTILDLVDDIKFKGVSQKICLLILKKEVTNNKPLIEKKGDAFVISTDIDRTVGSTIKNLGFKVGIGPYCWSHHKEKLNSDQNGVKLLYSSYIGENTIVEVENRNPLKKKYINVTDYEIIPNVIVFPRTSSKKLKMVLIENNEYLIENHVVFITSENLSQLKKLYSYLIQNKKQIENLLNSTTLSKFEVENIICHLD